MINETSVAPIGNSNSITDSLQKEKRNENLKDVDINHDRDCIEFSSTSSGDFRAHHRFTNPDRCIEAAIQLQIQKSPVKFQNYMLECDGDLNSNRLERTLRHEIGRHHLKQQHKTKNRRAWNNESMQTTGDFKHNEQSATGTSTDFVAQEEAACNNIIRERLPSLKTEKVASTLRDWECRAITTVGYVIGSTLVLKGPMVICMVVDAFGIQYENAIRDIIAILLALQCLIDPFVYAFRFRAIRKEIQKIVCCKKEVTQPSIYIN
ncbi:HTR4 [Mytilus coruscus]|uniref:HTR4 n=1 Tax=Mytilus coruscus TaxID=42192 RepID=A0A6J8AJC7_MYTCO|nr:HTR4 [Mytilus coruscus]